MNKKYPCACSMLHDVFCGTGSDIIYYACIFSTAQSFTDCKDDKKYVVVSARVHPGESNASWMLKGLVDFITGDSKEANVSVMKF